MRKGLGVRGHQPCTAEAYPERFPEPHILTGCDADQLLDLPAFFVGHLYSGLTALSAPPRGDIGLSEALLLYSFRSRLIGAAFRDRPPGKVPSTDRGGSNDGIVSPQCYR